MTRPAADDTPPDPASEPIERLGAGIDFTDPNSPLAPLYLRGSHLAAAVSLAVLFILLCFLPAGTPGPWAHLRFGRLIADAGRPPAAEPFSPLSDPGQPLTGLFWLAQVGYHTVYEAGAQAVGADPVLRRDAGIDALRVLYAALLTGELGLLLWAFRRAGGNLTLAVAAVWFVFLTRMLLVLDIHPRVFGEVLFAAVLLPLTRDRVSRAAVVVVPVLCGLWANVGPTFVAGPTLVAVALVRAAARSPRWAGDPCVRRLAVMLLLACAAVAANPRGPAVVADAWAYVTHPNVLTSPDWRPLPFGVPGNQLGVLYLLTLAAVGGAFLVSPRPVGMADLAPVLVFAVWPLFQMYALVFWLALVPCVVLPHLAAACAERGWAQDRSVPSLRKTLIGAAVAVLVVLWSPVTGWVQDRRPRPAEQALAKSTPAFVADALAGADPGPRGAALAAALAEHYPGGFRGRVFASPELADYLVWAVPRADAVTIYSQAQLFPRATWHEFLAAGAGAAGCFEVLDRNRVSLLVVQPAVTPDLAKKAREHPGWLVTVDEPDGGFGHSARDRLLVAVRKTR